MPESPESSPVVTMIGAGQLARMSHQAAVALGQTLRVLARSADEPAAQVTPAVVIGEHTDLSALRRAARGAAVVTFDHEQVPTELLDVLAAEGVAIAPSPAALLHAQDKLVMRRRLAAMGVAVPRFTAVADVAALGDFIDTVGGPVVIKAVRGGYDGRGVVLADDRAAAVAAVQDFLRRGIEVLAEERVPMVRELSALVARSPFGQASAWPIVETLQREGVCHFVVAPACGLATATATAAEALALRIAAELDVVGVMAVELFETTNGGLVVNELAMRPHNSGHWTMDGARTGQFEQHLRAVLDYPLGSPAATAPTTVMANVLGAAEPPSMSLDERLHHLFARMPAVKVHLYGKAERGGRKIGHLNLCSSAGHDQHDEAAVASLRDRAALAAHWLSRAEWTDGWDGHR